MQTQNDHEEMNAPQLTVPKHVFRTIRAIITTAPQGLETSVALFGARTANRRVTLFAVGPGPRSIHQAYFHQPDEDHLSRTYAELLTEWPRLEWIGSLHIHPHGLLWLSGHDRQTVRSLLSECTLPDFTAGIIQRFGSLIKIFPYFLSEKQIEPRRMRLEIVAARDSNVRLARSLAKGKADAQP